MKEADLPRWLEWAREIQALSQTGLAYSGNDYDTQRYFFKFGDLPPLSAARTNERHLAKVSAHLRDQNRPASVPKSWAATAGSSTVCSPNLASRS